MIPYDTEDELLHLMNATPYGLSASLWTNDLAKAMRLIPEIQAGTLWVNMHTLLDPAVPFGGIKASGMPAWGKSMDDEYIWNMAAFLQALPGLDAVQYRALVAASGGHAHGGGESGDHPHAAGADAAHDDHNPADVAPADAGRTDQGKAATGTAHLHADGMRHVHAADIAVTTPTKDGRSTAAATTPAPAAGTTSEKEHDVHHQH